MRLAPEPPDNDSINGRRRDAKRFREFKFACSCGEAISNNLYVCECQFSTAASVAGLRCGGRPSTILWRIWPRVVDAIKRVARGWPWVHVLNECGYVVPTLAHTNAATTIEVIVVAPRPVAALHHPLPRQVQRMATQAVGYSRLVRRDKCRVTIFSPTHVVGSAPTTSIKRPWATFHRAGALPDASHTPKIRKVRRELQWV